MKRFICFVAMLCLSLAVSSCNKAADQSNQTASTNANQQNRQASTEPKAENKNGAGNMASASGSGQIYKGLELSVLNVERKSEWKMPEIMGANVYKPKAGFECAVVFLKVRSLGSETKLDVADMQLEDLQGKRYKCPLIATDLCDPQPGQETECDLPFDVPKGAQLKSLHVGDLTIDLAKKAG